MVNKCGSCDLAITKRDKNVITCDACKTGFHDRCSGLNNDEFLVVSKRSAIKWFCRVCDPEVTEILTNLERFKKANTEYRTLCDDVEKKLADFDNRIRSFEEVENNPNITSVVQKVVRDSLPSTESTQERELIEKKKNNLIFFKVPESNDENPESRIKDDYKCLSDIFGQQNIDPEDISNIFPVGKKSEENMRLLVVKFVDLQTKQKYSDKAFDAELKLLRNNEVIKIGVAHDRTKKQREESRKRYEERKSRTSTITQGSTSTNSSDEQQQNRNFQSQVRGARPTWAKVLRNLR